MGYKNKAIEIEVEKYTEEDYNNMLREVYGDTIDICGLRYDTVYTWKDVDPTAYACGFSDYQETTTKYKCPICGEEYEEEEDALDCCPENFVEDVEEKADEKEN